MSNLLTALTLFIMLMLITNFQNFSKESKSAVPVMVTIMALSLLFLFLTASMMTFFVYFETAMLPIFLLIINKGSNPEKYQAAFFMMLYTLTASLPFFGMLNKIFTDFFSYRFLSNYYFMNSKLWLLVILIFLAKLPVFFLHVWLPKAHVEAPVEGSMILAGVLLKMGGYGVLKFVWMINMTKFIWINILMSLGMVGAAMTSFVCSRQTDLKVMIAFSSVAHMSMVLSVMAMSNKMSLKGGILMMMAHGICSANLFYLMNIMYTKVNSRNLNLIKGFVNFSPSIMLPWFISSAMNMSCPPSLNFISEIFMSSSIIMTQPSLIYLLTMINLTVGLYCIIMLTMPSHGNNTNFNSKETISIKSQMMGMIMWTPLTALFFSPFIV